MNLALGFESATSSFVARLVLLGSLCFASVAAAQDAPPTKKGKKNPSPPSATAGNSDEDYELFKLLADTVDQIERNYVKDVSRRELMEAAIRGMLSKLDQYSNYIPPSEIEGFKGSVESEFGGIGIQISVDSGKLMVTSPLYGTPAYRAGIIAGDWIQEIDGTPTKDMTIDDAVKRMKGKVGTEVKIKIVRTADEANNIAAKTEVITLRRDTVRVDTVLGDHRKPDDSWDFMMDAEKKIGYIRITTFGRHTTDEMKKAIEQLDKAKLRGLVLDLRFNPGGLLSSAIEISDLFVADGRIVSTAGRNVRERVVYAEKPGTYEGFPIAVLVNRFSASASEIVSACLQDHDRAIVVGERTWGKGSVQNIIELEDGKSALKLTTAGYQRPNGKNIHRFDGAKESDDWGVRPNDGYEVKFSDGEIRQYLDWRRQRELVKKPRSDEKPAAEFADRQLQKALDYLVAQIDKGDSKESKEPKDAKDAKKASDVEAKSSPNPSAAPAVKDK